MIPERKRWLKYSYGLRGTIHNPGTTIAEEKWMTPNGWKFIDGSEIDFPEVPEYKECWSDPILLPILETGKSFPRKRWEDALEYRLIPEGKWP